MEGGTEWNAGSLDAGPVHRAWQLQCAGSYHLTTGQSVVRAVWETMQREDPREECDASGDDEDDDPGDWDGGVAPAWVVRRVAARLSRCA